MDKTLFTYVLTPEQAETLEQVTAGMSALKRVQAPYTTLALKGPKLTVMLYTSGKLVVQGKEAQDFVLFTLEPLVLKAATLGYEEALDPTLYAPHMGSDESGKGDIFGPLVTCAAFIDETTGKGLVRRAADARDQRVTRLYLTQAGLETARRLEEMIGRMGREIFGVLQPEERAQLAAMLGRVTAAAQRRLSGEDGGTDE